MAVPRRTLTLLRKLANQVGATTDDTVRALTASWIAAWDGLSPAWQQGIAALADEYRRTGRWPAPWQVARIEAIANAQQRTEQSLTTVVGEASVTTRTAAATVSEATLRGEPGVIASQLKLRPDVAVPVMPAAAALRARQNRIGALHAPLAASATAAVRQVFTRPPTATDQAVLLRDLYNRTRAGFDSGLVRAATIARTELIDTYRTTAGLVHSANAQILTGWAWMCACDRSACPSCWSMHGSQFPTVIPGPESHPGCRCTRLPLTAGVSLPTAEARFRRLTRREQIAILGLGRWELWHSGRVAWGQLAVRRTNRGWRDSFVPRPVTDLNRLAGVR